MEYFYWGEKEHKINFSPVRASKCAIANLPLSSLQADLIAVQSL